VGAGTGPVEELRWGPVTTARERWSRVATGQRGTREARGEGYGGAWAAPEERGPARGEGKGDGPREKGGRAVPKGIVQFLN
jgi:hypothetical protein